MRIALFIFFLGCVAAGVYIYNTGIQFTALTVELTIGELHFEINQAPALVIAGLFLGHLFLIAGLLGGLIFKKGFRIYLLLLILIDLMIILRFWLYD